MNHTYTVENVLIAECTLEPIRCLHCGSLEVTFHSDVGDAYCAECGQWQTDSDKWWQSQLGTSDSDVH